MSMIQKRTDLDWNCQHCGSIPRPLYLIEPQVDGEVFFCRSCLKRLEGEIKTILSNEENDADPQSR